jgi:2-polyprenyl-3-methyl-5-hydroxy-6-metoxy-1,4-benzoquinol methylase
MVTRYSQKTKGTLLDIGAGTGAFAGVMQGAGWKVTALEPDQQARAIAKKRNNIQLQDPSSLFEIQAGSIDVVTMWHVLEHVHTLNEYISQFKKIIRKGGVLLIAVPNYTSADSKKYGQYWAAYDVPRHLYHFSPHSMQTLLKLHGLQLLQMLPMWFDSFYVSMLSEKYKSGKQQFIKGVWSGMKSNWEAMKKNNRCSSLVYVVQVL